VCQVRGAHVVTIEASGHEHVQQGFLDAGGTQCGICTPGMIVATRAYLEDCASRGIAVTEHGAREALAGNLCRCTGYGKVIASVLAAANPSSR
jgi:aerobic-type carbon monoxide dehydrogenase small subunit (CoxS/CutS family)